MYIQKGVSMNEQTVPLTKFVAGTACKGNTDGTTSSRDDSGWMPEPDWSLEGIAAVFASKSASQRSRSADSRVLSEDIEFNSELSAVGYAM